MTHRRHVEIVGAGMAGLAAGIAFAQRGWSVRLHERMPEIRVVGSGLSVFENTRRVFRVLDAEADVLRNAWRGQRFQTRDATGRITSEASTGPWRMHEVTRQAIMAALFSAADRAGVEVVLDSTVVQVDPNGELRLENGRTLHADLVVVADGIGSRLRDQLRIPYGRRPLRDGAIRTLTNLTPEEIRNPTVASTEYWSGVRRILVVPCSQSELYVALTTDYNDEVGRRTPIQRDFWAQTFPGAASIVERLTGEARWDRFETVKMSRWSAGRVVVLGDAAHAMAPNLGQGGACGMMNGLSLATRLETSPDIARALEDWERRERPLTDHTQLVSSLWSDLTYWPNSARAAAFWAVSKSKWLTAQTFRAAAHIPTGTEHLPRTLAAVA